MAKRQARLKQYQQTIKDHHNDIYCPEGQLKYNELDISGLYMNILLIIKIRKIIQQLI